MKLTILLLPFKRATAALDRWYGKQLQPTDRYCSKTMKHYNTETKLQTMTAHKTEQSETIVRSLPSTAVATG